MPPGCLLLYEALFEDFFVGEPQVGDIGGAEPEDVFQSAAHLPEMKIHADALEQFDEFLRAHGLDGSRTDAIAVQPMIRDNINGPGTGSMPINVEETPGFGFGWGEPGCYS